MDRTIRLLVLVVLVGASNAGNGYNYIRPAKSIGNVAPVVNSDGSTKSVFFFADPDDHQNQQRVSQQRTISYRQPAPAPYSRNTNTYSQVTPQETRTTYSQVAPQQSTVTYSQAVPQQNSIAYNQIAPQQKSITYNQVVPQQRPFTYNTIAPQQQISYGSNQIVQQQIPFITSQIVPQQIPITYNQVVPQQQAITYNQIIPQQLPIYTYQIAPQQLQYTNSQIALPVKQNLQVIFVRTPGYEAYTEALLKMAKEAIQSQTIVYVLSKEPDVAELTRRFKEIQATARKMPEVRFIKYKTNDEAVQAQQAIQAQYEALPGTSNTIGTQIGTQIGTPIGTPIGTETGSINYSDEAASGTSSSSTSTTTSNEDDKYPQSSPPFLPTGVDVVPGSSYLPPNQIRK